MALVFSERPFSRPGIVEDRSMESCVCVCMCACVNVSACEVCV